MLEFLVVFLGTLRAAAHSRRDLVLENLALRQQLAVLRRTAKRPRVGAIQRLFWVWLSPAWSGWTRMLLIVRPETVVRWHREGFRLFWRRRSRSGKGGRSATSKDVRALIKKMALANPLWGAPRIHGELLKLGIEISQRTVGSLLLRSPRPRPQSWRTFLDNHVRDLASMDFFAVPTAAFRVLFVLIILAHDRRRIVHFAVTDSPTAAWTAQQVAEAFPWGEVPRYLVRDRDATYDASFRERMKRMGIVETITAAHSPWQNPYVERLIGTIRRDLLDHVIVLIARQVCTDGSARTSPITIVLERISRSRKTHPNRVPSRRPQLGQCTRCPRSAGFIIATFRRAA